MLEQRKLRIVCFKATLTKTEGAVRLDIHRQLVREIRNDEICPENDLVRIVAVPELRDEEMFLLGKHREIPERDELINEQHTTQYWLIQRENLACAGRWITSLMKKGYYGYGKKHRRNNR